MSKKIMVPQINPPAAPPVSTRVVNGQVQLSKRRLADLQKITNVVAREELKGAWIKEALDAQAKNLFWNERRNNMTFVLNQARAESVDKNGKTMRALEAGRFLYVGGTGTKASAVFTKKKALEFISRLQEFADIVSSMPDFEIESQDE